VSTAGHSAQIFVQDEADLPLYQRATSQTAWIVSIVYGRGEYRELSSLPPGNLSVLSSVTYRWKKPDRYVPIFNDLANVYGAYLVSSLSDD
jgi:hypothetical protein